MSGILFQCVLVNLNYLLHVCDYCRDGITKRGKRHEIILLLHALCDRQASRGGRDSAAERAWHLTTAMQQCTVGN